MNELKNRLTEIQLLRNYYVIICSNTNEEKNDWMNKISILKMKCDNQKKHSFYTNSFETNTKIRTNTNNNSFTTQIYENNEHMLYSTKRDGKWVILQDWSTCTLACGGGTQTLHRLCVPPKLGGLPCEGEEVLVRNCNTQQCPDYQSVSETVSPTRIQIMKISERPQRYEVSIFFICLF